MANLTAPSESTSIPLHPRTQRPVGYAFVDLATVDEAHAAISALSGHEILERKVSVQVARKPEPEGGERRKRTNARGRGRGRGRGGRFNRSSRVRLVCLLLLSLPFSDLYPSRATKRKRTAKVLLPMSRASRLLVT